MLKAMQWIEVIVAVRGSVSEDVITVKIGPVLNTQAHDRGIIAMVGVTGLGLRRTDLLVTTMALHSILSAL